MGGGETEMRNRDQIPGIRRRLALGCMGWGRVEEEREGARWRIDGTYTDT